MRALLVLLVLSPALAHAKESACFNSEQSRVSLVTPYKVAPQNTEQRVGVKFTTKPGWHVYWKNSGDAGYPPVIDWSLSPNLQAAEQRWPAPHRFMQRGNLESLGYEGEVIYPFTLRFAAAADSVKLKADVDYLVCEDECVPYRCMLELDLPTAPTPELDPPVADAFAKFEKQVPVPWPKNAEHSEALNERLIFSVEFMHQGDALPELFLAAHNDYDITALPTTVVNEHAVVSAQLRPKVTGVTPMPVQLDYTITKLNGDQNVTANVSVKAGPARATPQEATAALPLWWALILAWLGGLILNVMPCVLPVLSVKLIGLLEQASDTKKVIRHAALGTTLGILLSFGGLFALSQIARRAGQAVGWGMQFQEPTFVVFLLLVVVLFAFNLWGMFEINLPSGVMAKIGGTESGSFASHIASGLFATLLATPCSAPFLGSAIAYALTADAMTSAALFFMIGVGLATPYLLLALRPGAVRFLPRPGMWMVKLKHTLGYALAATAVWLVFVLSAQIPRDAVAYVLLSVLVLALGIQGLGAHRLARVVSALLIVGGFATPVWIAAHALSAPANQTTTTVGGIEWRPFDRAEAERLANSGKYVFVDVTADWCFTCKANEHGVLASSTVANLFKQHGVVAMRADWTNRSPAITEYLKDFGRYGIPFYGLYPGTTKPVVLPELLTEPMLTKAFAK